MAKISIAFGGEVIGEYPLDQPSTVIGRDADSDIHIDNLGISRAQCQFIHKGATFIVQDMNSANGTFVNGERINEHYLKTGDEIVIGKFAITFDATGYADPAGSKSDSSGDLMSDGLRTYVVDTEQVQKGIAGIKSGGDTTKQETARLAAATSPTASDIVPGPIPLSRKRSNRSTNVTKAIEPPANLPTNLPPKSSPPKPSASGRERSNLDFDPLRPRHTTAVVPKPTPLPNSMPSTPTPPPGNLPAIRAADIANAGAKPSVAKTSNLLLYMSLATNVVLIALIVVLIVFMSKIIDSTNAQNAKPQSRAVIVAPEQDEVTSSPDNIKEDKEDEAD